MANVIGRGVRVEIGTTEATAIPISAVTQASPGVATSTAHGLANGSCGYFLGVAGMVNLEGQAVRVANQAANTFELEGIDTTDFPAFTAGTFVPITAWATVTPSTGFSSGGGEGSPLDVTRLIDDIEQQEQGLLAAQSVSFNVLAEDSNSTGMAALEAAALAQTRKFFRITLKTGAQRIFYAQPSLPGEDVQKGAVGTGQFNALVKGRIVKLVAL
jgi:hypothetical protein